MTKSNRFKPNLRVESAGWAMMILSIYHGARLADLLAGKERPPAGTYAAIWFIEQGQMHVADHMWGVKVLVKK
jgi:hypothetical protein